MTRRAFSSGARGSPGLRDCGVALAEGLPAGFAAPGLAGAGFGFVGRLALAAGFAAGLPLGLAAGLLPDADGGLGLP